MRRELTTEYQLFAENRAFALRDNFEILEDELKRLALSPQVDFTDGNRMPEAAAARGRARELGPLQHRRAAAVGRRHVPALRAGSRRSTAGSASATAAWFKAARERAGADLSARPTSPTSAARSRSSSRCVRDGRFAGALVGVIALGEANVITPSLHDNLPRETDAVLVDAQRRGHLSARPRAAAQAARTGARHPRRRRRRRRHADRPRRRRGSRCSPTRRSARRRSSRWCSPGRGARSPRICGSRLDAAGRAAVRRRAGGHRRPRAVGVPHAAAAGAGRERDAHRARRARTVGAPAVPGRHRGGARARRRVRAHGDLDPAARPGAARGRRRCSSSACAIARASWWRRSRRWSRPSASRPWARPRRRSRTSSRTRSTAWAWRSSSSCRIRPTRRASRGCARRWWREIARLRDVVDSLLSFSRSPRIEPARRPAPVIGEARELLADLVADRGATVIIDAPSTAALLRRHKIQGVMVNLVKNAVEAGQRARARGGDRHRRGRRGRGRRPRPVAPRRASTCSSRSSRRSPTARAWACRRRGATSRRTAGRWRSRARQRSAARCFAFACRA